MGRKTVETGELVHWDLLQPTFDALMAVGGNDALGEILPSRGQNGKKGKTFSLIGIDKYKTGQGVQRYGAVVWITLLCAP